MIKNILIVRFRQMGDTILATSMLNTLRRNYPDAEIDIVLNDRVAPLFEGHPSISNIIAFSDKERHNALLYLRKAWKTARAKHYDVIIDMRSTINTLPFTLFSLGSRYRIGVRKPYTRFIFNHRVEGCEDDESMIDHNLKLLEPLRKLKSDFTDDRNITLSISDKERQSFAEYMKRMGIDLNRPILLAGVTAKLANKTWAKERMVDTLQWLGKNYPGLQMIFNYAPGEEERNAREIYSLMGEPSNIFIDVQARSSREMAAMASNITFYFGNEGGGRHIVQAMGKPSFVICSPVASKTTWLPDGGDIVTEGISAADLVSSEQYEAMSHAERYNAITADIVKEQLGRFCEKIQLRADACE